MAARLDMRGVRAELYKLLLYEQGSFFKPHKDSEKAPGMVGTLVVALPSQHAGGEVHLSLAGSKVVLQTSTESQSHVTALGWYSDVTHEVKPLAYGYRLVLTYNLISAGDGDLASTTQITREAERLRERLLAWPRASRWNKLVYALEHQYTDANLELQYLRGRDMAVGQALRRACAASGHVLLLANMTRTFEVQVTMYGDDERTPIDALTDNVYTCDGVFVTDEVPIAPAEILGPGLPRDRDPDSCDEGEFLGNEGGPDTHRYNDTVRGFFPIFFFCIPPPFPSPSRTDTVKRKC